MERRELYVGNMTWKHFSEAVKTATGVIVPIGSCEQHGYHLPLDTDTITARYTAIEVAKKTNCLVLPSINFGQVWSARNFPGTIALSPDTIIALVCDVVESLERHGVRNIIFLSGHTGNMPVLQDAARKLMDERGWRNVWYFSASLNKAVIEETCESKPCSGIRHAAEGEASTMLYMHPELVYLDEAVADYAEKPEQVYYRPIRWDEFKEVGCFGDPSKATAEKGKIILEKEIEEIADKINRFMNHHE